MNLYIYNNIISYKLNDITFNSNKTKLMHFTMNNQSPGSIQFMRYKLNVISKCTLLVVEILNNFSVDIDNSVKQFNYKYMSLFTNYDDELLTYNTIRRSTVIIYARNCSIITMLVLSFKKMDNTILEMICAILIKLILCKIN